MDVTDLLVFIGGLLLFIVVMLVGIYYQLLQLNQK